MGIDNIITALRGLRANKFRSSLTVFSITLGAFCIVFMASLATSGLATLARDIEELGAARMLLVNSKKPERELAKADKSRGYLDERDRDLVFGAVPHVEAKAMFASRRGAEARDRRGNAVRTDIVAADAGYFDGFRLEIARGRAFTEEEDQRRQRLCVVGHDTAKKLFEGDPIGQFMTLDEERCRVVGVLADREHRGVGFGFEWKEHVVMPFSAATETRPDLRDGATFLMRTDDPASNDIVKRVANAILVDRHHGVDDFQIWDFAQIMDKFEAIFTIMEAVVGLVASIGLFVGGIGIMNMMLVSVSERTREIGIRKALGASPAAIAAQFLTEATVLSMLGGLVGTAFGIASAFGGSAVISAFEPKWITVVSVPAVVVAVGASLLVGVGFGYVPARRASALSPVEAMRR